MAKKYTIKLRVCLAAYKDEKNAQAVEIEMTFPREPRNTMDWVQIWEQIRTNAHKQLAVKVKYPEKKEWEEFDILTGMERL